MHTIIIMINIQTCTALAVQNVHTVHTELLRIHLLYGWQCYKLYTMLHALVVGVHPPTEGADGPQGSGNTDSS